jgi:hypothetical protein
MNRKHLLARTVAALGVLAFASAIPAAEAPKWKRAKTVSLPGVKVSLSEPVLVARSKGYLWFPTLIPLANGDLLAVMNDYADMHVKDATAQVSWSSDGGRTWSPTKTALNGGDPHLRLPDSDELLLPYYLFPQGDGVIGAPYQVCPKGKQELMVMKEGVRVSGWPRPDRSFDAKLGLAGFVFNGQVVELKDNGYLATLYGYFKDTKRYSLVTAESRNGVQWKIRSTIADESCKLPGAEGPCESALCRLKDGRLMCIFRLNGGARYGQTWSSDEGMTWTEPVAMKDCFSVQPSVTVMKDGTIILSGGRPGLFAWINRDGTGKDWQQLDVRAVHNTAQPKEPIVKDNHTSSYTEVVSLDETHVLYIYDRIPNGWAALPKDAAETNSVWVMRLTVERQEK